MEAFEAGETVDSFTIAAVETVTLHERLLAALDALGAALSAWLAADPFRALALRDVLAGVDGLHRRNAGGGRSALFYGGTRDLGVVLDRLAAMAVEGVQPALDGAASAEGRGLREATLEARSALEAAVVAHAVGPDYADRKRMMGIAIWLPRTEQERLARARFFAPSPLWSECADPCRWPDWIERSFAPPTL